MRPALLALLAAVPASALRAAPRAPPPSRVGRRELASLAAGFALLTADSRAALAAGTMSDIRTDAERGAEPAYKMQPFADTVCVERTPLGACREYGAVPGAPAKPPVERMMVRLILALCICLMLGGLAVLSVLAFNVWFGGNKPKPQEGNGQPPFQPPVPPVPPIPISNDVLHVTLDFDFSMWSEPMEVSYIDNLAQFAG